MPQVSLSPIRAVSGRLAIPGDKSISHRYVLLGALASGRTTMRHLAPGADVRASLGCVAALGATVVRAPDGLVSVDGWGETGPTAPAAPLDCLNSGTTMRLLLGLLAGFPIPVTLIGDASLSSRPMRRVMDPLLAMGAQLTANDGRAPVAMTGGRLRAIEWTPSAASAQIKSAILLAGLRAEGRTTVVESEATRDHTERAFPLFGLSCSADALRISVNGGQPPTAPAGVLDVPGDPSSAAVWAALAASLPGSDVTVTGVALNPRRLGFVAALRRLGAAVTITETHTLGGEPVGTISVAYGTCADTTIEADEVPGLIDELPVLAACASHGRRLEVRGAGELRVKESDRIAALVTGLRALGVAADEYTDGFVINGRADQPRGGLADAVHDHRLVMAFTLVALGATGPTTIESADAVAVSYPDFWSDLAGLRVPTA